MQKRLYRYLAAAILVLGVFSTQFATVSAQTASIHAMRVDYKNYSTSRAEVSTWEQEMKAAGINQVSLGAGRAEWTYFKWAGHTANWSSDVTKTGIDFLADDSARFGKWAQVNAVVDVLSPNYIKAHPDKAAVSASGLRSTSLVSTAELVNGAYGQQLLDMIAYIAANYPVNSISISELSYHVDGYGADDLALYKAATGRKDWPRLSNGQIDINDVSIGTWRSNLLGGFLGKASALAHKYGKQLFMEVGVSVNSLSTATNNYGTNYAVMLQNVDRIVVTANFAADGYTPQYLKDIDQYLAQAGSNRVLLSIGLWGVSGTTVSATNLQAAVQAAQSGGMPNLQVAPGSLMTSSHWQVLNGLWGVQVPTATNPPTNTPLPTVTKTTVPTTAATKTNTPVPTNTVASTAAPTNTAAPTRTNTSVPTTAPTMTNTTVPTTAPTRTNTATFTATSTPAPTNTTAPTRTNTPLPTNTATFTSTATAVPTNPPTPTSAPKASGIHVMRVEYANYANSRAEVPTWTQEMKAAGINMVALAAGRTEWAYFKWGGHTADWSSDVTDTGIDFLAADSASYGQFADVNAVIDVYAPNYILAHPEKAAINVLGQPSPNLVSTAELVNGAFGQKLLDMVQYIAVNYPNVDSISITELSYRIDGYGPDDLALYKAATGRSDWPRQSNGQVDIDDPSIGNWRSAVLGQFLGRATAIAHQYGKQLYMDVSVSVGNLGLATNNKGTNYSVMLQNVDKIVVWDYFGEDGFAPSYSKDIAQFLAQYGLNRVILSVGLWGATSGSTVSAADFQTAIQASQAGGMPNIWICPGSMMTSAHWQVLNTLWGPQ